MAGFRKGRQEQGVRGRGLEGGRGKGDQTREMGSVGSVWGEEGGREGGTRGGAVMMGAYSLPGRV